MKALVTVAAAVFAVAGSVSTAQAQPFDEGNYRRKGDGNLVSTISVRSVGPGLQQLREDTNIEIDLGCKFHVNVKSERALPRHYNQKDFVDGKFISCSFKDIDCGWLPSECTAENVTLLPGRYYKQGSQEICGVWKQGASESAPACFTRTRDSFDVQLYGIQIRAKP